MKKLYFTLFAIYLSLNAIAQTIVYVDIDATGNNDGTSWQNAYTNLNTALSNGFQNSQIWVAEGTYYLTGTNDSFLIENGEEIFGGFNGTETALNQRDFRNNLTILSGDVNENDSGAPSSTNATMTDNAKNIVKINSPLQHVVLDGLTIEGAFSTTAAGGGIYVTDNNLDGLRIQNCIIKKNVSANRAGLLYYADRASSYLHLFNTIIQDNVNTSSAAYTIEFRIAGNNANGSAHLVNNLFKNNICEAASSGVTCGRFTNLPSNGELYVYLINNTIIDNPQNNPNSAPFGFEYGSSLAATEIRMSNNIFYNNTNTIKQFAFLAGSTNQAYNTIMNGDSYKNVQDFSDAYPLQNTLIINSSPFNDYANEDYTPITTYQTNGNTQVYDAIYPTYDLAGNTRLNNQGEIAIGAYQFDSTASIDDSFANSNFKVYPNPSNSIFNIESSESINNLKIMDISGKIIYLINQLNNTNTEIDLSNFPKGIYFLSASTTNGIKNIKLIKS